MTYRSATFHEEWALRPDADIEDVLDALVNAEYADEFQITTLTKGEKSRRVLTFGGYADEDGMIEVLQALAPFSVDGSTVGFVGEDQATGGVYLQNGEVAQANLRTVFEVGGNIIEFHNGEDGWS